VPGVRWIEGPLFGAFYTDDDDEFPQPLLGAPALSRTVPRLRPRLDGLCASLSAGTLPCTVAPVPRSGPRCALSLHTVPQWLTLSPIVSSRCLSVRWSPRGLSISPPAVGMPE
jgi:hypothetical protein